MYIEKQQQNNNKKKQKKNRGKTCSGGCIKLLQETVENFIQLSTEQGEG